MKFYTITAAGSGCNLGRVAEAKTMKVAKVIGRLVVTQLPAERAGRLQGAQQHLPNRGRRGA